MRHQLAVLVLLVPTVQPVVKAAPSLKKTDIDRAIDRALVFLDNTQNKADGSWRAAGGKHVAITSLSVMAFLSAGHVPGEGKYGKTIDQGVRWVLSMQRPNGLLANDGGHEMYHHGIATLMLAEVAGMMDKERGKEVRRAVEKAIALILKAQRKHSSARGGWRYRVQGSDADISVTGWQVMALRAAKNLGCDVPAETIADAVDYIKRCQNSRTGAFSYMPGSFITVPCTGTSVLALELCGKDEHRSDAVLRGASFLIRNENLPRWGSGGFFFYGIYYGAQATFQVGGNYWSTYRARLHQIMLSNQSRSGYWQGGGSDGRYGAVYGTAMSVLALTVEYRFLPIYQRGEEPKEKGKES
jgi:hypothetical protein